MSRIEVTTLCSRFYMGADTDEIRKIHAQALRSPLSDKFIRTRKPVLTSGEIRPTDIVPVIAPNQSGKEFAFPMKWGFSLPKGSLVVNARVEMAATKPTFQES